MHMIKSAFRGVDRVLEAMGFGPLFWCHSPREA
jgi:hypothetical protein